MTSFPFGLRIPLAGPTAGTVSRLVWGATMLVFAVCLPVARAQDRSHDDACTQRARQDARAESEAAWVDEAFDTIEAALAERDYQPPALAIDALAEDKKDLSELAALKAQKQQSGKAFPAESTERIHALITRLAQRKRVVYASALQDIFDRNGFDLMIGVTGENKDQLWIKSQAMNEALMHKFQSDMKLDGEAGAMGYRQIVYVSATQSWIETPASGLESASPAATSLLTPP